MRLVHFTFDGGDVVANLRSCERLVCSTTGDLSCEDHGSWLSQGYEMEMGEIFGADVGDGAQDLLYSSC